MERTCDQVVILNQGRVAFASSMARLQQDSDEWEIEVSNVDPEQLTRALAPLDPASTLFIVTSKTFTTSETLANAHAARDWLKRTIGGVGPLSSHFVAVTGNALTGARHDTAVESARMPAAR